MSQLQGYLNSLNEEELARLETINLKGQEKRIFDHFYRTTKKQSNHSSEIADISETHLYKIQSVLLKKFFKILVPEGGVALFKHLLKKGNIILFRHELKSSEKNVKDWSQPDKEKYYLQCFHLLIDLPYKFFDEKLLANYGSLYLANKAQCSEADRRYVECHILFAKANYCAAKRNPKKAFGLTLQDLESLERELVKTDFYLAQYYLYRTICSYFSYYEKNIHKVLQYLEKAIALQEKIQYFFPVNLSQFLGLLHADLLFTLNKIEEAHLAYQTLFNQGISENMYGYQYHCEQYSLLLIVKEKFKEAEQLIGKAFDQSIKEKLDIYATRGAMTYAKLYLSSNDLKSANNYIQIAKEVNEKSIYLPFDVQIRVLENIFFILKGDFDFAAQLANKNLKFIQSQKDKAHLSTYVKLWKHIFKICQQRNNLRQKSVQSLLKETESLQKEFVSLYCNLISKAIGKTFDKEPGALLKKEY